MPYPENPQSPYIKPREVFGLDGRESLLYRISDERFQEIFASPDVQIHRVSVAENRFGSFLFVTMSREVEGQRYGITFYGQGYHQYRERWIQDLWFWYELHPIDSVYREVLSKGEARQQMEARQREIDLLDIDVTPSEAGIMFSIIADLVDDDGALSEILDLDSRLHDLYNEEDGDEDEVYF